jgi:hypothetical protein
MAPLRCDLGGAGNAARHHLSRAAVLIPTLGVVALSSTAYCTVSAVIPCSATCAGRTLRELQDIRSV